MTYSRELTMSRISGWTVLGRRDFIQHNGAPKLHLMRLTHIRTSWRYQHVPLSELHNSSHDESWVWPAHSIQSAMSPPIMYKFFIEPYFAMTLAGDLRRVTDI